MTSDVREASERLRKHYAARCPQESAYWVEAVGACDWISQGRDKEAVLQAYLVELDPTPVDEAWLESVGFDSDSTAMTAENDAAAVVYLKSTGTFFINGRGVSSITTRGQLRTLARALGISLTQPATQESDRDA